ncbi:hypothetical protein D1872_338420 [compost metagenome]
MIDHIESIGTFCIKNDIIDIDEKLSEDLHQLLLIGTVLMLHAGLLQHLEETLFIDPFAKLFGEVVGDISQ